MQLYAKYVGLYSVKSKSESTSVRSNIQENKMSYEKELIIKETTVSGNISDFNQSYEGLFYPEAKDLPSKFALYIHLTGEDGIKKARRSIYFSSHEQLKTLIFELTKAYFYFRDKRIKPVGTIEEFRIVNLNIFLSDLKKNQLNIWKK